MVIKNEKQLLWLVEDDERIAALLKQFLTSEGFEVRWFESGEQLLEQISDVCPDLIILDLMLPGIDGVEVCMQIRPEYENPILMLTAHSSDIQEVTALNAGVDDFLNKPIRTHILLARINALLRRHGRGTEPKILKLHDLEIDHGKRSANRNGLGIELSDSEFELLWILALQAGSVVTREELFEKVRGKPYDGLDRSVDMRVSKLRKKLNSGNADIEYIRTLRQLGYLFLGD